MRAVRRNSFKTAMPRPATVSGVRRSSVTAVRAAAAEQQKTAAATVESRIITGIVTVRP